MDSPATLSTPERSHGNVRFQMISGILACVSNITFGTTLAVSAIILPQLQSKESSLYLTVDEGSWFASTFSVGNLLGYMTGGFQSDFLGRKRSMMVDNVMMILGASLIASANSYTMLLSGRIIGGFAIGSCITSLPAYLSEISHPQVRGTLCGIFGAMYYIGSFIIITLGAFTTWRLAIGICVIFPVVTFLGLFFCPESPAWLLRHEKKDEALKTLTILRGSESEAQIVLADMEEIINKDKKESEESHKPSSFHLRLRGHIREMTCPTFYKPFAILFFFLAVTQAWAGMSFITLYMVTFFQKMDIPMDPYLAASTISINRLVFGLISIKLIGKYSKKKLHMVIMFIMTLSNASLALHQYLHEKDYLEDWGVSEYKIIRLVPLLCVSTLYASLSLGFSTIPKMLTGELLPAKKRSIGCGIIGFFESFANFVAAKISPVLMSLLHIYGCFTLFSVNLIIGIAVIYFFLPDTQGQSLEDIERYYYEQKKTKKGSKSIP